MPTTTPSDAGQHLHDRASRGEPLSAEENAQLQEWYARQDQEESALLAAAPPPRELAELPALIERTTAQVVTEAQRVQALTAENARLRREVAELQKQLLEKLKAAPA